MADDPGTWVDQGNGDYRHAQTGEILPEGDLPEGAQRVSAEAAAANSAAAASADATFGPEAAEPELTETPLRSAMRGYFGYVNQYTTAELDAFDREIGIFEPRPGGSPGGTTRTIGQMTATLMELPTDEVAQLQMMLWQAGLYGTTNQDYYTGDRDVTWGYVDSDTVDAFSLLLEQGILRPGQTLTETAGQLVAVNSRRISALAFGRDEEGNALDRDGNPIVLGDIALEDPASLRETFNAVWHRETGQDATPEMLDSFVASMHQQQRAYGERQNDLELAAAGWERDANGDLVRTDEVTLDPNELGAFREAYQMTLGQETAFSAPGMSMDGSAAISPSQQGDLEEWWEEARQAGFPLPRPNSPIGRQAVIDWYLERSWRLTGGDWEQVARQWEADTAIGGSQDPIGQAFAFPRTGEPPVLRPLADREAEAQAEIDRINNERTNSLLNPLSQRSEALIRARVNRGEPADPEERRSAELEQGQATRTENRINLALTNFWTALSNRGVNPQSVAGARAPTGEQTLVGQGVSWGSYSPGGTPMMTANLTIPAVPGAAPAVTGAQGGTTAGAANIIGGGTVIPPDAAAQAAEQARVSGEAAQFNMTNTVLNLQSILRRGVG